MTDFVWYTLEEIRILLEAGDFDVAQKIGLKPKATLVTNAYRGDMDVYISYSKEIQSFAVPNKYTVYSPKRRENPSDVLLHSLTLNRVFSAYHEIKQLREEKVKSQLDLLKKEKSND